MVQNSPRANVGRNGSSSLQPSAAPVPHENGNGWRPEPPSDGPPADLASLISLLEGIVGGWPAPSLAPCDARRDGGGLRRWRPRPADHVEPRLLYELGQELATPLTPVLLQVHLLRSGTLGPTSPAQELAIACLDRNVSRLVEVLLDLLRVAGARSQASPAADADRDVGGT